MSVISKAVLVAAALMMISGMYCMVRTRNIVRIIIAIEVIMKSVTLLFAFAGSVNGHLALAQSFILTIIVLEVVVAVVAAGIAICVYRCYGDKRISHLTKLKG